MRKSKAEGEGILSNGSARTEDFAQLPASEMAELLSRCVGKRFIFFHPALTNKGSGEIFLFGGDWVFWRRAKGWRQETEISLMVNAYAWRMSGAGWCLGRASDCCKAKEEELGVLEGIYGKAVESVSFNAQTLDVVFDLTDGCRIELFNLAYADCGMIGLRLRIERSVWALGPKGLLPTGCYLPRWAMAGTLGEDGLPATANRTQGR